MASTWYEKSVLEATARYIKSLTDFGVSYPLVVMLCFLDARGALMAVDSHYFGLNVHPIDPDVLVFPDVVLEAPADGPAPRSSPDLRRRVERVRHCSVAQLRQEGKLEGRPSLRRTRGGDRMTTAAMTASAPMQRTSLSVSQAL
jgi:hypothetical protein